MIKIPNIFYGFVWEKKDGYNIQVQVRKHTSTIKLREFLICNVVFSLFLISRWWTILFKFKKLKYNGLYSNNYNWTVKKIETSVQSIL